MLVNDATCCAGSFIHVPGSNNCLAVPFYVCMNRYEGITNDAATDDVAPASMLLAMNTASPKLAKNFKSNDLIFFPVLNPE